MKPENQSIQDFIYWIEKNNYEIMNDKKFTKSQIAQIIGKAMVSYFDESETPY